MAQIREFESTTESYFILDGVSYPKVYEAMLDSSYSSTKIKLVGTNRDNAPLVFSTHYLNIRVDRDSFDTASEAISRLNQVVFSKGGGSGDGGTFNGIETENSETVAFTGNGAVGNPLNAKGYNGSYSTEETLTGGTWIDGKSIYRKVIEGSISAIGDSFVSLTDLNIEYMLPIKGNFFREYGGDGASFNINSKYGASDEISLTVRTRHNGDAHNRIYLKSSVESLTYTVILEYTKITDPTP